jgi:hypothetical protein
VTDQPTPAPDPFAAPGDNPPPIGPPARHFDGQQWLVWDGTAWVPDAAAAPEPARRSRRTLLVVVAILVLGLVAAGVLIGTRVANAHRPIVIPATLGGLPKNTDPQLATAADQYRTQVRDAAGGTAADVGVYGSASAGEVAVLAAARGGGTAEQFFTAAKNSGADLSEPTAVGNSQCATSTSSGYALCERSSSSLFVAVFLSGSDTTRAAAMVDEAWDQQ